MDVAVIGVAAAMVEPVAAVVTMAVVTVAATEAVWEGVLAVAAQVEVETAEETAQPASTTLQARAAARW